MDILPYWRMVLREVIRRTFSHFRTKVISGIGTSMLLATIQYVLQLRNLSDTEKIAISIGASAVIVIGWSFIKALIHVPASLYVEPGLRTAKEAYHYGKAKEALKDLGMDAVTVLRHLQNHDSLTFVDSTTADIPPLPQGMNLRDTRALLNACVSKDLVTSEQFRSVLPTGFAITGSTYKIAIGKLKVLEELLYPTQPVSRET
jgi:hypothetical protein